MRGYLLWIVLVPVLLLGGIILILMLSGSTAPTTKSTSGPAQVSEGRLDSARHDLTRQTDLNTCRGALKQINAELGEKATLRPPALSQEQKDWLRDQLKLSNDELGEVESNLFTRLDNHHLFRCLLMRDVAHDALEVKGVRGKAGGQTVRERPLHQAARAFSWVMRQVRLRPGEGEPDPPTFAVQRGLGTALERALIFLALLEQQGDRDAAEPELLGFLLQVPDQTGALHLWACGVVVGEGKDVYLFDPSLGLPLPGPNGEGIATLAQIIRQPEVLAQLNGGGKSRYPVTMEQVRAAQAQLAFPLSALSPRMGYLQDKLLAPAVRVRLASDAAKNRDRIKTACSAGIEKPVPIGLSKDKCTLLRRFLPVDEGGTDTSYRERRFLDELVPWNHLPGLFRNDPLFSRKTDLGRRVQSLFAAHFISRTVDPGSPRDLMLRGRYRSAVEKLVDERNALRGQKEQLANMVDLEGRFQKWVDDAARAHARLKTAKNPEERQRAEEQVKAAWASSASWPIHIVINSAAAAVRNVELAYQLGLCSQEEAEQLQARLDLQARTDAAPYQPDIDKARKAWRKALENWQRFDEDAPPEHPDRPAARLQRGRSESMFGDHPAALASWKAVASWKNGEGAPTDLERIAASFLAQQAEKTQSGNRK